MSYSRKPTSIGSQFVRKRLGLRRHPKLRNQLPFTTLQLLRWLLWLRRLLRQLPLLQWLRLPSLPQRLRLPSTLERHPTRSSWRQLDWLKKGARQDLHAFMANKEQAIMTLFRLQNMGINEDQTFLWTIPHYLTTLNSAALYTPTGLLPP